VILDVMMPGMSGWEVCRRIKGEASDGGPFANTGVIMLTGIGENLNDMTSPLFSADAWLNKPFEFTDLDQRVRETLSRYSKEVPEAAGESESPGAGARRPEKPAGRKTAAKKAGGTRKAAAKKGGGTRKAATKKTSGAKKTAAKKTGATRSPAKKSAVKATTRKAVGAQGGVTGKAGAKKASGAKKAAVKAGVARKTASGTGAKKRGAR
jgi:hypothetical protein